MNDNWAKLYAEIWKLAVKDDYAEVRQKIFGELVRRGVNKYAALEYISQHSEEILGRVQWDVYEEAQNYGPETKRMRREHINRLVDRMVGEYEG